MLVELKERGETYLSNWIENGSERGRVNENVNGRASANASGSLLARPDCGLNTDLMSSECGYLKIPPGYGRFGDHRGDGRHDGYHDAYRHRGGLYCPYLCPYPEIPISASRYSFRLECGILQTISWP
jgi:hypothetical protein